ncbi:MAG: very short patch repair endonuclease [Planctomycetota bacterium]
MSREKRSRLMSRVRGRGNKSTELALAKIFRSLGVNGWRRHKRVAGCYPDFIFPRRGAAVFVDGCFWHGCPRHYTRPASRMDYWDAKIVANRKRDKQAVKRLSEAGWTVWRLWECQVREKRLPVNLQAMVSATAACRSGPAAGGRRA